MRNKPVILNPPPPEPIPPPEPPGWFGFEPPPPRRNPGTAWKRGASEPTVSCEGWFLILLVFLVGVAVGMACYGVLI